jgi:hypothetical protein
MIFYSIEELYIKSIMMRIVLLKNYVMYFSVVLYLGDIFYEYRVVIIPVLGILSIDRVVRCIDENLN